MTLRFYRRDTRWFADIPDYIAQGGTEDDCEMVSGADEWLDFISKGKDNIVLQIDTKPLANRLDKYHDDDYGATYMAHEYNDRDYNQQMWLCNVTKFLFGDFPQVIYYQKA